MIPQYRPDSPTVAEQSKAGEKMRRSHVIRPQKVAGLVCEANLLRIPSCAEICLPGSVCARVLGRLTKESRAVALFAYCFVALPASVGWTNLLQSSASKEEDPIGHAVCCYAIPEIRRLMGYVLGRRSYHKGNCLHNMLSYSLCHSIDPTTSGRMF